MIAAAEPVGRPWSFEKAVALEQKLGERLELIDGAVYAMADGSLPEPPPPGP